MLRLAALIVGLIMLPAIVVTYGFELHLWRAAEADRQSAAARAGYLVDRRDKATLIAQLDSGAKPAIAYVPPEALFRDRDGIMRSVFAGDEATRDLFALGGISRKINVVCNEAGPWFRFPADRHGFNNPDAVWDNERLDIVVLGDSFALGNCVPHGRSMIDLMRRRYKAMLNLGAGGNGPLLMLAALREYGARFRPRIVIWQHYDNDFDNLARERRSPALSAYVADAAFSQGLIRRQKEIDRRLALLAGQLGGQGGWRDIHALRVLRLQMLRTRLAPDPPPSSADTRATLALFRDALKSAADAAAGWGGRLVVLYLPPPARYFETPPGWVAAVDRRKSRALAVARALGLKVIDAQAAFDRAPDPRALAFGPSTHYSEAGYRLAAETLIRALGPVPPVGGDAPRSP